MGLAEGVAVRVGGAVAVALACAVAVAVAVTVAVAVAQGPRVEWSGYRGHSESLILISR